MEFKFNTTSDKSSNYNTPPETLAQHHSSSSKSYFEHALRAEYERPVLGEAGDYLTNPGDEYESYLRELEKEQIREELELERRLHLEAEVRREMLIEREIALLGAHIPDIPNPSARNSEIRATEPKPEKIISGVKRKAETQPPTNLRMTNYSKKGKQDFYCELCHVSTNGEQTLKQHFEGKKHKSMEKRMSQNTNIIYGFGRKLHEKPKE